ncbi:hypothetical protein BGZ95_007622 [Linnemannia exigua]|uniref:CHAT domain-containing protein n=1 Tax=Linnemannia exigua TaxID=604196 RepID=A0AAD4H6S7_9FUNG|nr:hypothetical protein BGZ95_007622 [Linnemannia exigua]
MRPRSYTTGNLDICALKNMLGNIYHNVLNTIRAFIWRLKGASKSDDHLDSFRAMCMLLEGASESEDQEAARSQRIEVAKLLLPYLEQGPTRNKIMEHLASWCYDHFKAMNSWQSLEDALEYLGQVLEATEVDVDYARLAVFYAKCLQARFMRGRNTTDLENAIDWAEKSTDLTRTLLKHGAGIESLVQALGNLWHCLFTKVHQLDEVIDEDFKKMMAAAQEAVDVAVDNNLPTVILAEAKNNLGMSYQFQWDRCTRWEERNYNDLDRSLELGWEVVAMMKGLSSKSNASNAVVAALSNLSFRLQRAYLCYIKDGSLPLATRVPNGEYLLDQAVDLLAESTAIPKTEPLSVPTNTLAFVSYIKDFPDDYRGYILGRSSICLNRSVYTLEQLCVVAAEEDRRNNLTLFYGISRYAAAAHLQLNRGPFAALQILEKGRGIANATLQEENMNKEVLADVNPDFARRYIDALQALKDNRFNNAPYHERSEPHEIILGARKKLLGMPGVFHPPKDLCVEEMMSLAEKEDIVLVNITNLRSDAIIIRKGSIHTVDLPNLDEEVLSEKSWEIQTRLAKETQDEHTLSELQKLLTEFYRHLWKSLVKPVLTFLGYTSSPASSERWPHIRWIPTGVLCLYPIHAAGLSLNKPDNTMNRVISTYATSLSSLYHIRQQQGVLSGATKQPGNEHTPGFENSSVLVISMPDTMDQQPLTLSSMEAAAIATIFPSTQTLTGSKTQDVLTELAAEPKIVHFSCHGTVDYDFPSQSLLLTSDWKTDPLTTARLQALSSKSSKAHSESRLAFLSACFAANGGVENQQDENIHLASSMQHAGFSNVVGSTCPLP